MYSSYRLTLIYIESKESMGVYDEVKNMFMTDDGNGEVQTDEKGMTIANSSSGGKFTWDYEKMLAYNQEALGYIRQDNGDYIDNPILQHSDNDYYLNHLADNQVSSVGSIFVDYRIEEGLEARNAIIYGHNMGRRVNNIMFGSLNWYHYCDSDPEYYKNHPTFDVYVGYKHYKYYIFATYKTQASGSDTYTYSFESDEAFLSYIEQCKKKSKHTYELAGEITAQDKIITLSTCTASDEERMIVQAVRREQIDDVPNVPDEETMTAGRDVINIGGETTPEETTTEMPSQEPQPSQAPSEAPSVAPPAPSEAPQPIEPQVPSEAPQPSTEPETSSEATQPSTEPSQPSQEQTTEPPLQETTTEPVSETPPQESVSAAPTEQEAG